MKQGNLAVEQSVEHIPQLFTMRMGLAPEIFKGQKLYRSHIDLESPEGDTLPIHGVGTGDHPKKACVNALIDLTKTVAAKLEMKVLVNWDHLKDIGEGVEHD